MAVHFVFNIIIHIIKCFWKFIRNTISCVFMTHSRQAFMTLFSGNPCNRELMGRSGIVFSYNFPLDYGQDQTCIYKHELYGFKDGEATEICFQFKR